MQQTGHQCSDAFKIKPTVLIYAQYHAIILCFGRKPVRQPDIDNFASIFHNIIGATIYSFMRQGILAATQIVTLQIRQWGYENVVCRDTLVVASTQCTGSRRIFQLCKLLLVRPLARLIREIAPASNQQPAIGGHTYQHH